MRLEPNEEPYDNEADVADGQIQQNIVGIFKNQMEAVCEALGRNQRALSP